MLPYGRHYLDEEDIACVVEVLRSDFITQGPKIREFEEALARYCGARYAVTFNSGTSALHAAYFAAGLGPGDEFIVPAITFAATANAGVFLGARPIFADIEEDTGNINPAQIENLITPKTKLIVPVHYAGHPADLEKIHTTAQRYGLKVIEDACHALGAKYQGVPIGSCQYSDMTVFSFHPVKHITTGEGGAVLTNRENYYEKLLMFRNHGITKEPARFQNEPDGPWYYEMQFLGWNYRMTDFQAALGISQLKKLDQFLKRRREIAAVYHKCFSNFDFFDLPKERPDLQSAWHLYVVRLKGPFPEIKAQLFTALKEKGIGVQVHYLPVYWHPFYQSLGYETGLCPRAEGFYRRAISLPLFPAMTEIDVDRVKHTVIEVLTEAMR